MAKATLTAEEFIQLKKQIFESKRCKEIRAKDISRNGYRIWKCVACTFMVQSDHPEKVFVVERLQYVRNEGNVSLFSHDHCQYRIGYFIVAKVGKRKGNWWWGQYCPFIPSGDLHRLLKKAEEEGTILPAGSKKNLAKRSPA